MRTAQVVGAALLVLVAMACVDRLPDQDLRILQATPVAKLSVDLLVQEYAANAGEANRRYFGKAVEITGTVGKTQPMGTGTALLFMQKAEPDKTALEAHLLDDRAAAIVEAVKTTPRITLRCFAETTSGPTVVLKSCVAP
jgi:tRNA_anti-like